MIEQQKIPSIASLLRVEKIFEGLYIDNKAIRDSILFKFAVILDEHIAISQKTLLLPRKRTINRHILGSGIELSFNKGRNSAIDEIQQLNADKSIVWKEKDV